MKGQRTLFDNFITANARRIKKGRSERLLDRRDSMLLVRYYYHTEIKRLRFDDVLKVLSEEEFFIETQTILNRLGCLSSRLDEFFKNKPSINKLKELSGNFSIEVTPKEKERYEAILNNKN